MAPIEVSSSSNVGRVDSGKDCVNTYLEDVVTTTDSTADIVTKEVASLEDEITTKATTQVEAFHSDIMDIANLILPATEIILKEVESKVESKQSTLSNKGERVENIHSSGNSSKSKSSGKSGSQKKKKGDTKLCVKLGDGWNCWRLWIGRYKQSAGYTWLMKMVLGGLGSSVQQLFVGPCRVYGCFSAGIFNIWKCCHRINGY